METTNSLIDLSTNNLSNLIILKDIYEKSNKKTALLAVVVYNNQIIIISMIMPAIKAIKERIKIIAEFHIDFEVKLV